MGDGEEGEVSELCLEEDGRRLTAGQVTEQGDVVGVVVNPFHVHLGEGGGSGRESQREESIGCKTIVNASNSAVVLLVTDLMDGVVRCASSARCPTLSGWDDK